jgi:hypothetical protein
VIGGLDTLPEDAFHMMFHAGTGSEDGQVIATGGRVLNATGRGATLQEARDRAYALAAAVDWPEGVFRRDIGWRALSCAKSRAIPSQRTVPPAAPSKLRPRRTGTVRWRASPRRD